MFALLAYVGSLIAAAAGVAMLFQLAAGSGPSDNKSTTASAQVRKTTTGVAKSTVSSATKAASRPVERRAEARKRKKMAVREKPRRRLAERRPEYWSPYYYSGRSYNRW